ncbi:hypothetical protein [Pistricoccus aurantiacus]|uniref:hypothetical protein n=1 Tax=Pistricoccus aurantiacus TaxID=1883414 RepID=UPI003637E90E
MKHWMALGLATALLGAGIGSAQGFERHIAVSALAGTTGVGADVSWRFHEHLALSAQYAGGLSWNGDLDTDEADYEGDLNIAAGALKLDYYPFAGRFYVTAGIMLPDIQADIEGYAKEEQSFEFNDQTYSASEVGVLHGKLTVADGVQPYLGLGWRASHRSGFGFFSELGVMATDAEVSLRASGPAADNPRFQDDLRKEERKLKDDVEEVAIYPVAVLGISYTF